MKLNGELLQKQNWNKNKEARSDNRSGGKSRTRRGTLSEMEKRNKKKQLEAEREEESAVVGKMEKEKKKQYFEAETELLD